MKRYRAIAEYYDAENAHLSMLAKDVPFFLTYLPRRPKSILELAVGTGRAAIPIAQAGHRVVGVDYAGDMLEIARTKRIAAGLTERRLELLQGDILTLDLGRRFDWVCLFFNTFLAFTTLDEQDQALQTVRRHLDPAGRFWLDIFQPDLHLLANESSMGLDPAAFWVEKLERTVMRTVDIQRRPERQLQRVTFNYRWFNPSGNERRQQSRFDLTWIFPRELQLLLERNSLLIEHLWGDYDGSEAGTTSPRMIACCRIK